MRPSRQDLHEDIGSSPTFPVAVPASASPSLSFQLPSPPSLLVQLPPVNLSSGGSCTQLLAPADTRGYYDHLAYDELRDPCRPMGYAGRDLKAVSKTRLATMDAVERKRLGDMADAADTSETSPCRRNSCGYLGRCGYRCGYLGRFARVFRETLPRQ